eukprot:IDg17928t1
MSHMQPHTRPPTRTRYNGKNPARSLCSPSPPIFDLNTGRPLPLPAAALRPSSNLPPRTMGMKSALMRMLSGRRRHRHQRCEYPSRDSFDGCRWCTPGLQYGSSTPRRASGQYDDTSRRAHAVSRRHATNRRSPRKCRPKSPPFNSKSP